MFTLWIMLTLSINYIILTEILYF